MLDQAGTKEEIQKHQDEDFGGFVGWPADEAESIAAWGDILDVCASAVVPATTTAAEAKAAFEAAAVGMSTPLTGGAVFVAACNAYVAALMAGMTGYAQLVTPVFTALDFTDASLNADGVTAADAADFQAGKMVARFQTGQVQLIAPPNTVVSLT